MKWLGRGKGTPENRSSGDGMGPVAQRIRARGYEPRCLGFESLLAHNRPKRYPFVEGRSSFSWEYGMGYSSAVVPGTRTLARDIFSTPSYLEKAGAPCVLEPIIIFRLT
ncbi:hypothetical protein HN873_054022 [Arachis hypogaea]